MHENIYENHFIVIPEEGGPQGSEISRLFILKLLTKAKVLACENGYGRFLTETLGNDTLLGSGERHKNN